MSRKNKNKKVRKSTGCVLDDFVIMGELLEDEEEEDRPATAEEAFNRAAFGKKS